jgi:Na+-driven multidrug efflux pump
MIPGFILMPQIAGLLGAEGKLLEDSVLYGRIFILALPAWIWVYEFQLFFVTAEKPGLGLAVTVCAGLCNVVLDALFIIGFRWGLAGAAAASALTQVVGGVFPLVYFSRKNNSLLRLVKPVWDGRAVLKACTNGTSEFMSEAAWSLVGIIYNIQLLKYAGEKGVIIYGLLMYVSLIFSAVFVGYSNGAGPLFSYHYGAQNHMELRNLLKRSLIIGLTSAAMFAASEALARPFSALFLRGAENLLPESVHAFRIVSVSYLFAGLAVFASAFFTALNDGLVSARISFLRTFVFELGAVLLLPPLFGVDGIWYSVVLAEMMAAVGDYSLVQQLYGLTDAQVQALKDYYFPESSGGTGGTGRRPKPKDEPIDAKEIIAASKKTYEATKTANPVSAESFNATVKTKYGTM